MDILFKGVRSESALKKRYRELMKIFHPDNQDGDDSVIHAINIEYDRLKKYMVNLNRLTSILIVLNITDGRLPNIIYVYMR